MLGWGRGVQDAWDVWGQGDATCRLKPLGCIWMPPLLTKSQTPGVLRVPSAPAGSAPGDWFSFCRRQRLSPNNPQPNPFWKSPQAERPGTCGPQRLLCHRNQPWVAGSEPGTQPGHCRSAWDPSEGPPRGTPPSQTCLLESPWPRVPTHSAVAALESFWGEPLCPWVAWSPHRPSRVGVTPSCGS